MSTETDADPIGHYCEYLDKEMTIMGLLTAFAVAVPALISDRIASAKPEEQKVLSEMWAHEQAILITGSLGFFLAALAFYLQRSHLAFYYGQLRLSRTEARYEGVTSNDLLRDVDSWAAWVRYNTAFALLIVGFAAYGVAVFAPHLASSCPATIIASLALPAGIYISINWWVKTANAYEDDPWRACFRDK